MHTQNTRNFFLLISSNNFDCEPHVIPTYGTFVYVINKLKQISNNEQYYLLFTPENSKPCGHSFSVLLCINVDDNLFVASMISLKFKAA